MKITGMLGVLFAASLGCALTSAAVADEEPSVKASLVETDNAADVQSAVANSISDTYTSMDEETPLVHVYTPDEINQWVEQGSHIYVMKNLNQCQFASDVEQRAKKGVAAAYEFLYGELLLNGVCYTRNEGSGIYYLQQAAELGYPAAMRRLAFFYEIGRYVQQDVVKSEALMHEAAMMGFVPARIDWGGMLARNLGSPSDYEEAYSWLNAIVPSTPAQATRTREYMAMLRDRMPVNIVKKAMRSRYY